MNLITPWYEQDTRFIPAHEQPATLIDLALSRGLDNHRLLRGTGLFYDDVLAGQSRISPQQFFTLIGNAWKLLDASDTSFLFGQRMLPGHYGVFSQGLQQCGNLYQALEHLVSYRARLTPLLAPRLLLDEHRLYLFWQDTCGAGEWQHFLLEACTTAIVAMSRHLSGEKLPWEFYFSCREPRYVEQYWVHLGDNIHFQFPVTLMSLNREYLFKPWPGSAPTALQVSQAQCAQQLDWQASFPDQFSEWLYRHAQEPLSLERAAREFSMSPASLKRKLQKHGTHFQEQLDLMRMQMALTLYWIRGYSNEQVAAHLHFSDTTNFRRSFKRWTGLSPSEMRERFSHAGG